MEGLRAEDPEALLKHAVSLLPASYAPYSNFNVACLLIARRRLPDKSDAAVHGDVKLFEGVNVENGSYSLTMCAEGVAVGKAVSAGYTKILKVFVIGRHHAQRPSAALGVNDEGERSCWPCGACRQILAEFAVAECEVMTVDGKGGLLKARLADLLPRTFRLLPPREGISSSS